jgi:hypothetical protein
VARKAKSPVVMVALSGEGGTPRGTGGRVAVTVGDTKDPLIALEFAFRAASLRDVGVVVFWVGKPCVSSRQEARLAGSLRQVQRSFPAVEVSKCVVALPNAQALPAEAREAALVVVGSRTRIGLPQRLPDSMSSGLRLVCCPVAIVADRPRRRRTVADAARAQPSIGRLSRRLTASRSGRTARGF